MTRCDANNTEESRGMRDKEKNALRWRLTLLPVDRDE